MEIVVVVLDGLVVTAVVLVGDTIMLEGLDVIFTVVLALVTRVVVLELIVDGTGVVVLLELLETLEEGRPKHPAPLHFRSNQLSTVSA